jgi:prepilin-type N-terminal cleavage/methylation domain-containing protein
MKSYDNITAFLIKYNSLDAQAQKNLKARLQRIKNKKGFTLTELMFVVALFVIVAFIITVAVVGLHFIAKMW